MTLTPLIRWLGGKGSSIGDILPHVPPEIERYAEPMLGGGALFWALLSGQRIKRAVLADINADLMTFYKVVRDHNEAFLFALSQLANPHETEEDRYYRVRREYNNRHLDAIRQSAAFLYLNKHDFNGLYRVNADGHFNASWGKISRSFDVEALRAAGTALQGVELSSGSYEETMVGTGPGTLIYVDPPYYPATTTSFHAYDASRFTVEAHVKLAAWVFEQRKLGATVLVSNSDLPEVRALYADCVFHETSEKRMVACKTESRKAVPVVLIVGAPLHSSVVISNGPGGQLSLL